MRLLRAVHQLLGTPDDGIRLSQCDLWGKRGSVDNNFSPYCNSNQRIHCDYPNHTLVMPPSWENPEVVSMIVYYDESKFVGGETRVVPREGPADPAYHNLSSPLLLTPGGRSDLLWVNDCEHAEEYLKKNFPDVHKFRQEHLYPRECKVGFETGSILFYRHDIWHRYVSRSVKICLQICNTLLYNIVNLFILLTLLLAFLFLTQRDTPCGGSNQKDTKSCVPPERM